MVLRKIGVLSTAKVMGCMYAIGGLIGGVLVAFMSLAGVLGAGEGAKEAGILLAGGVFAVIFLPVLYGVLGFITGAIGALLYNLITPLVGGIEMDFSRE